MLAAALIPRKALAAFPIAIVRNYAAAAAAQPAASSTASSAAAAPAVSISTTKNGIKVATFEDYSPTSGLAAVVTAGSRAEAASNVGVAHFLKNFAFKNNTSRTAFRINREAEILGSVLSANLTREHLIFSAEFLRDDAPYFAEILADVVSRTKFQDHEFTEVAEKVALQSAYARATPEISLLEAAHQVAFHNGLGYSLFASPTSKVGIPAVKEFAKQVFNAGNIAFVGSGVDHRTLASLVEAFVAVPVGAAAKSASTYHGGESRIDAESDLGHFVLAYQGAAASTFDFAAAQVLKYVLGGDKFLKWSAGASTLSQIATNFSPTTHISAFNLGYSDAGLFGVYVAAPAEEVGKAVEVAIEQLKATSKSVKPEDFKRAVAQAKFAAASSFETRIDRLEILGGQALSTGTYVSPADLAAQFDTVKSTDVVNIAQKILKSKPTVVAYGDVHVLPYADSLSL